MEKAETVFISSAFSNHFPDICRGRCPAYLIPRRDVKFFERHFPDYRKAVRLVSQSEGYEEPCIRKELPDELKHLSVDGVVYILADESHVNCIFHFDAWIGYFEGVAYAPRGHFVVPPERIIEPIKGHEHWYYVGD